METTGGIDASLSHGPRADIACAISTTAERLNDDDLVGRAQQLRRVAHLLAVDEDADVRPNPVLLVDHAETNSGVLTVQVRKDGGERRAARLGLAALGIRAQRAGYEHPHRGRGPPTPIAPFPRRGFPAGAARCRPSRGPRHGSSTVLRWSCRSTSPPDPACPPSSPGALRSTTPACRADRHR